MEQILGVEQKHARAKFTHMFLLLFISFWRSINQLTSVQASEEHQ